MMTDYFLGVDWGGTRIKLGAVSVDGRVIYGEVFETQMAKDVEETYRALVARLHMIAKKQKSPPCGVGLALTGPTDPERGTVLLPGKIKGLEGFPVVQRLRQDFGDSVWAQNDGISAMYAEKHVGLAREHGWAVVLTIGTGVGSGVMLDGRILQDPRFMFGSQAGHMVIDFSHDQLCLTGARGTGEMLCSATSLALAVRSGLQRGIPSTLTDRHWRDSHAVDFKAVIDDGVAKGDLLCLDELRRWSVRLGWLLLNIVHLYSPEIIILAGGAMLAHPYFLDNVREQVFRHMFRYPRGVPVPIRVSELGDHIGVIGAAMMVKERLESSKELDRQRAG
jgi:glucokinase